MDTHPAGRHPQADTPRQTPAGQTPPCAHTPGRHPQAETLLGRPPWADTLQQTHQADTPLGRHPPPETHTHREADTPWVDPPAATLPPWRPLQRLVHILLECILVIIMYVQCKTC